MIGKNESCQNQQYGVVGVVSSPGTLCRSYLRLQYNQLAGHNECNKRLTLIRLISMFYTVEASSQ